MAVPRKPHAKSKLKTLPAEKQRALFDYLETHSLEEAEAWLATDGVDTNPDSLSKFRSWYLVKLDLDSAFAFSEAQADLMARFRPGDAKIAREFGEFTMLQIANQNKDAKLFTTVTMAQDMRRNLDLQERSGATKAAQKDRQLAQKDQELQLAQKKFQRDTAELFLEWFADEQAKAIAGGGGTRAEKIEALGQAMFGEDW